MHFSVTECHKSEQPDPDNFKTWDCEQTMHYQYDKRGYLDEYSDVETKYFNPISNKPNVYQFSYDLPNHEEYTIYYCTDKSYITKYVEQNSYFDFMKRHKCKVLVQRIAKMKLYRNMIKSFKADIKLYKKHFYITTIVGVSSYGPKRTIYRCTDRTHQDQYLDAHDEYWYYNMVYDEKLCLLQKLRSMEPNIVEYRLIHSIIDYHTARPNPDYNLTCN